MGDHQRRPRARALAPALLLVALLALAGCGSASGIATDDVRTSSHRCPVDLAAAAKAAGVKSGGAVTGRTVKGPSAAVARIDGAVAECALPLADGGRLSMTLVAADGGAPVPLLLPEVQARTGLGTADLGRVI